ncbi:hypothetical protein [Microcoleus sp. LAD1_D3]
MLFGEDAFRLNSQLPITNAFRPNSQFPIPNSQFPIPNSQFPAVTGLQF